MSALKRTTVQLEADIHLALQLKARDTDQSVSQLINQAVRDALTEDADDIAAAERARTETPIPFDDAIADLKRRGKL